MQREHDQEQTARVREEAGVNPARSRHCDREVDLHPLRVRHQGECPGKAGGAATIREPGHSAFAAGAESPRHPP